VSASKNEECRRRENSAGMGLLPSVTFGGTSLPPRSSVLLLFSWHRQTEREREREREGERKRGDGGREGGTETETNVQAKILKEEREERSYTTDADGAVACTITTLSDG